MNEDTSIAMLLSANQKLAEQIELLQEQIEDLKERMKPLESQADAAFDLAKSVRELLSWREQPPTGMEPSVYEGVDGHLRNTVERRLRDLGA